jgi:dynein heavy chain, axonemal
MENRLNHDAPLFEVKFELNPPHMLFFPSFEFNHRYGFDVLIENIIIDIYNMADVIPCVAQPSEEERIDADGRVFLLTYASKLCHL